MQKGVDGIINFAAESHVDRSIEDPDVFIRSNINGVHNLLEASRRHSVKKFLQISTDEVYGERNGFFTEETLRPPLLLLIMQLICCSSVNNLRIEHKYHSLFQHQGPYRFQNDPSSHLKSTCRSANPNLWRRFKYTRLDPLRSQPGCSRCLRAEHLVESIIFALIMNNQT